MAARYILAVVSIVFLVAAVARVLKENGRFSPASRTWGTVGAVFALVSIWLWLQ